MGGRQTDGSYLVETEEDGHNCFEEIKARVAKWPWYEKLWNRVGRTYRDVKFNLGVWLNRKIRGYSHYDVWELASNNSRRMVMLLEKYKALHHGFPGCLLEDPMNHNQDKEFQKADSAQASAKWVNILDDMIFYHKVIAGMKRPSEMVGFPSELTKKSTGEPLFTTGDYYDSYDLRKEEKHQYRRGAYYMWKYYPGLWD